MGGAVDRILDHLHYAGVLSLCAYGAARVRIGSETGGAPMVLVAGGSAGPLSRIGFPMPGPSGSMGLAILLYVPRLFLMLALLLGIYVLLWRDHPVKNSSWDWTQYAWMAIIAVSVASACLPRFTCNAPCGRSMRIGYR